MNQNGTGSHDESLEAVALLALGVLPETEARAVAEHARACVECRSEYAALRSVADVVGVGAPETAWTASDAARLKARILTGIGEYRNGAVARPSVVAGRIGSAGRRSPWLPYLAAAAALVFAVLSSANLLTLRGQIAERSQQVAELHSELETQTQTAGRAAILEQRLAEITAPQSKHYAVSTGEVVRSGGRIILAVKLGDLAPGKVYQAWVLRSGARTMAPSVTFVAESGVTLVELPESAAGLRAVAVSVEPAGGSKAPTSKPAFVRTLS